MEQSNTCRKKVKEIEEGIVTMFMDIISDKDEINTIMHSLLKSTMRDLLVIIPTANTFFRFENEGLIPILKEEAKRGLKIRILIPNPTKTNNSRNNYNNTISKQEKQEKAILQELIRSSYRNSIP